MRDDRSQPKQRGTHTNHYSVSAITRFVVQLKDSIGRRDRDRTGNPQLRRLMLYPIELLARHRRYPTL